MTLVMAEQPMIIHVAVWACVAVFLVSFAGVFSGALLILSRTGALEPEEWKLPYWHRAALQNKRASSFMLLSEFRYLRILMFTSIAGSISSFGGLFSIIIAFGERT